MAVSLTDRYIDAVTRSLRPTAQDDVRDELAGSISDAIDARLEQGEVREEAERAVLTELGDPAALAAGYADRPLQLIGPKYYLAWWRLLKLLLIIVPICAFGGVLLGQSLAGAPLGEVIGSSIATAISAIVHVAFWTTLVFAILERTDADTGIRWSLDQLPESREHGMKRSEMFVSVGYVVFLAGALFWDQLIGFVRHDGAALPVLNPGLWPWWILALIALIVAEGILAVVIYRVGRWTGALAVVNTALAVCFMSWALTLLGRDQLINPAFVEFAFEGAVDGEVMRILAVLTAFCVVAFPVWDIIDGWVKTRRDARVGSGLA